MKDRAVRVSDLNKLGFELKPLGQDSEVYSVKGGLLVCTYPLLHPLSKEVIDGLKEGGYHCECVKPYACGCSVSAFNAGLDKALEVCGVKEVSVEEILNILNNGIREEEITSVMSGVYYSTEEIAQAIHNLIKWEK